MGSSNGTSGTAVPNDLLYTTKEGRVHRNLANLVTILRLDKTYAGRIRLNTLSRRSEVDGYDIEDTDITEFRLYALETYHVEWGKESVSDAVELVARENEYNPIVDYLAPLEWDGVPRLHRFFSTEGGGHMRCSGNPDLLAAYGRRAFIALVARALDPGCKMDTMPMLYGEQGILKSTAISAIGGEFYTDANVDMTTRDGPIIIGGKWVVEIAELSSMRRADIESVKKFITHQSDHYRPVHARRPITVPRSACFWGTTNSPDIVRDHTGSRRFWIVHVLGIHEEAIKQDRDQLFAEAKHLYMSGEQWWLTPQEEALRVEASFDYHEEDSWEPIVAAAIRDKPEVTIGWLLSHIGVPTERQGYVAQRRAAGILTRLGWSKHRLPKSQGRGRIWRPRTP